MRIVVMGVSGSGKTTIGKELARQTGGTFLESDEMHGPENIAKMSAGVPLTDEDRWPWLERVAQACLAEPGTAIIACSALKRSYRDFLRERLGEMRFVLPHGDPQLIADRMKARKGHFMPSSLLQSQLATLEMPGPDEPDCFQVPIVGEPAEIVAALLADPRFSAQGANNQAGR